MLPPAIALFHTLLSQRGHTVGLFDSTDFPNPENDTFNSDKAKEENLNVRAFDDDKLKVTWQDRDVYEAYMEKVNGFKPDLLALSCTEDMFPIGVSLLKKSSDLEIPTIMGGVFPTFAPDKVLAIPEVDMVCVGEGEHLIVALCDRMDRKKPYDNIPGLFLKKPDGKIIKNPMGPVVNINENPFLDISIFREGRLYRPMEGRVWKMFPLETHRGCPYSCTYCNSPSQSLKYKKETNSLFFRKKSVDKIRDEIVHFRDNYGVEAFYFWADTFFALSEKEFDEFVEMYSEFNIPFWCQTRPETITHKRVDNLAKVGMFRMAFGIEHGNKEFRKRVINRNISNEKIVEALNIVNEVGVKFSVNNILGFPYETRELTFDTIELNRQISCDSANAYSFSPFHGTPLRKIAEKEGYISPDVIARSLTRPTLLNMPQYPPDQIEGMRRCFVLYTKLPKSRWKEIEIAESLTSDGDKKWKQLRDEVAGKYMVS